MNKRAPELRGIFGRTWQRYAALMLKQASDVELNESYLAFMAGASVGFTITTGVLGPSNGPDLKRWVDLQLELEEFGKQFDLAIFEEQAR